jgi:hypothetical protein
MFVGYFALASSEITNLDLESPRSCKLWFATWRCARTLTLEARLSETEDGDDAYVACFKNKGPLRAEKSDSVPLRCLLGGSIDIRLKLHVGPTTNSPTFVKEFISMLVEIVFPAEPMWRSECAVPSSTGFNKFK